MRLLGVGGVEDVDEEGTSGLAWDAGTSVALSCRTTGLEAELS